MAVAQPQDMAAVATGYQFLRPEQELTDFTCQVTRGGVAVLSLSGKRLVVQKKKVGYFRFGLLRETVIEDGRIQVLQAGPSAGLSNEASTVPGTGSRRPGGGAATGLGLLPADWLGAFVCRPVSFVINEAGSGGRQAQILASSAELSPNGRAIRFQGQVVATAGGGRLETDLLDLSLADSRLEVKGGYSLTTATGSKAGHGLASDVFFSDLDGLDGREERQAR